jgi:hypothetical protein
MTSDRFSYIHSITRMILKNPDDAGRAHLKKHLTTPPPASLLSRVTDPDFKRQFTEISALLDKEPDLLSLFQLYLVTALLLTSEPVFKNARRLLIQHLDIAALLGFAPPPKTPGTWCCMPVLLTSAGQAHVRHMILGKIPPAALPDLMPPWAVPLFDRCAYEAIHTAARAARVLCGTADPAGLFCFPLTPPASFGQPDHPIRFEGKSLGLPLTLGFAALLHQHTLPGTLAATGEITDQGEIRPVAHLDLKKSGAAEHEFTALIHPASGTGFSPSTPITCLPADTLNQAYALFSLYAPESEQNLMLLSACLNDPRVLAKNIDNLPCAWLQWITRYGLARPALDALATDAHLFAACSHVFENKAAAFAIGHARAVQALIPEPAIVQLTPTAPLSVFRWCTASLALANHCGNIQDAKNWEDKGLDLAGTIAGMDIGLVADFFNHALVARHNQYRFSPDLPQALHDLLTVLETLYHEKCKFGCPTDPVLGRLYGTLMQHFAFCGPAYLDQTRNFFHKAVKALGQDRVIEYNQEWLRQYNYLTYALLDTGDLAGARQSLATCFECSDMDDLVAQICDADTRLSPWHTAVAARYFAQDTTHPDRKRVFRHLLQLFRSDPGQDHPRQLTALNLGQTALDLQDNRTGTDLLHHSIDLCFSPRSGPTIQVMALLPISFLPDTALPPVRIQDEWEEKILSAASLMDSDHFARILKTPFHDARLRIRQTPAVWFPFNYR